MKFLFFYFFIGSLFGQYSIKGKVHFSEDVQTNYLELYEHQNIFLQKFLKRIEILDSEFYVSNFTTETDVFMIKNPKSKKFYIFICDGKITVDFTDSLENYRMVTANSPLNLELQLYDKKMESEVFFELRKLDTLIQKVENNELSKPLNYIFLKDERNKLFDKAMKDGNNFRTNYILSHLDSFISLYYITMFGMENTFPEYVEIYNKLNSDLKKSRRAVIFK